MAKEMTTRTEITGIQRGVLLKSFAEGMQNCRKETLEQRELVAQETGLGLKSVNVRKLT